MVAAVNKGLPSTTAEEKEQQDSSPPLLAQQSTTVLVAGEEAAAAAQELERQVSEIARLEEERKLAALPMAAKVHACRVMSSFT